STSPVERSVALALLFCACSHPLMALMTATNWACVIELLPRATLADARDQVVALPGGATVAPVPKVMPPDSPLRLLFPCGCSQVDPAVMFVPLCFPAPAGSGRFRAFARCGFSLHIFRPARSYGSLPS